MGYTINDIEKIVEFKTWTVKNKTDELLRIDCDMYCNNGMESSKRVKEETRINSRKIYMLIKKIDPESGLLFLKSIDNKE